MKFKAQKESISYLFTQICKLRRNQSNVLLSASGIHAGQDVLLYYLDIHDGQTISALVGKMDIQFATISNMIDRMEAAGLITRQKDALDKRVSKVFLMEQGKASISKINHAWRAMDTKTLKGLTNEEQEQLRGLLSKVKGNLNGE